jgi:acetylglutamate kinase
VPRIALKLGGSILEDAPTKAKIAQQVADAVARGTEILIVHGGGKRLNRRLEALGIESRFVAGLRVTDEATLSVALMVLAGEVNKELVVALEGLKVRALGICGADASCVRCEPLKDASGTGDGLGFVGQPAAVDRRFFERMFDIGLTPVVASIALGMDGHLYNVNADQMASICASGNGCGTLVYLTDVAGVLDGHGRVIPSLDTRAIEKLRREGVLTGGMLPKTAACLDALRNGVGSVFILPGRSPGALSRALEGGEMEGTCIHGNS